MLEDIPRTQLEETPYSGIRATSRWTDDPGGGIGRWGEEWGGVMWNGVRGIDEVGRKDRNRKLRKTRSGKKEHIRIAMEFKDIVVPDRFWNFATS